MSFAFKILIVIKYINNIFVVILVKYTIKGLFLKVLNFFEKLYIFSILAQFEFYQIHPLLE